MAEQIHTGPQPGAVAYKRRMHWHVFLSHFPIAFFTGAFGFQILHLFMAPAACEFATNVLLTGAVLSLVPTTCTGWREWEHYYHGAKARIFLRKIQIAVGLLALGVPLLVWRVVGYGFLAEVRFNPPHFIYLGGNTLLIIGAILEGLYGGRLSHK